MTFSIIIPIYNAARYLRATLESVAAQTFRDFECICVDDGSSDGSADIVEEFCARDSRFRLIRKSNGGEGSARNAGLDVAKGAWLCYLDADDLYRAEMLAAGHELIRRHPMADIVAVNRLNFKGEGLVSESVDVGLIESSLLDVRHEFAGPFLTRGFSTGYYRRDTFGDIRFTPFVIGEDRVYVAECVSRCAHIALSDVRLYLYRQHDESIMNRPYNAVTIRDGMQSICRYLAIVKKSGKTLEQSFRRVLVNQLVEEMPHHIRHLPADERADMWRQWRDAVAYLSDNGLATRWGSCLAVLLQRLPAGLVMRVFCEMPYWLKRKGLHR